MRYYLAKPARGGGVITGPYSVEELNQRIHEGEIDSCWAATADIGEPFSEVIRSPDSDWMPIAKVPGVVGVRMPSTRPPPTCPKCTGEMQEGFVADATQGSRLVSHWTAGNPFWDGKDVAGKERYPIQSFRCTRCGYLESYAVACDNPTYIFFPICGGV